MEEGTGSLKCSKILLNAPGQLYFTKEGTFLEPEVK